MSLVWHIVWKDLRRLALPLALWLVLLAGEVGWMGKISAAARLNRLAFEGMGSLITVWEIIVLIVGFLLAAGLVMEDSLVSTRAFWRTRPVSGLRLLVAKAAGAVLMFSLLPVLVMLPVWLWCGFSSAEVGAAAGALAGGQLPLSLMAFTLACVTEVPGQFIVRFLGAGLALPLWLMFSLTGFSGRLPVLAPSLVDSRAALGTWLIVLMLVAVVLNQYLTRRLRHSVGVLVAGCVLLPLLGRFWPWDFAPWRVPARETDPAVHFSHTGDTAIRDYASKAERTRLVVGGEITGVPADSYLWVRQLDGLWQIDGQSRYSGRLHAPEGADLPAPAVVRRVAGLAPAGPAATQHWDALGYESTEWLLRWRGRPLKLEGNVRAVVMRGASLGRLPLHLDARLQVGSSRTRLTEMEHRDGQLIVRLDERDALPAGAAIVSAENQPWLREAWTMEDSYIVSGPAFPEPVVLGRGNFATVRVHSIQLGRREFVITAPTRVVDGRTEEIPGWEENAVLEKIRFRSERTLVAPVAADIQVPPNL